ncbi:hypothetical protein PIB30_024834 [Stylosanthes scabra]|uniref:Uncharacterized protein n=1 Tax=Stylosanthes scabra TaxID=79078 RepID=A0ABU6Y867_9FABA|nr:hypothetical protein [Stylosanthes scabra]
MISSYDNEAWKKGGRPKNHYGPKPKSLDSRCSPSDFSQIMKEIEQNNLKMAEVIDMWFRDLQHMPNWTVKQGLLLHLASRFDLENNLIKDDVELKAFVTSCTMNTNEERREFREAFILLLAKSFLWPTTNNFISPERHLPLVVDVANPNRCNWSLQIFTWIKDSIRDFQRKGVKHLSICMFLLVVILFQHLEFGPLNRYYGSEP